MKKKVLSILLALVMVFSLIPTTMWAEEGNVAKIGDMEYATLAEAIAAANDGDTVTLLADVTLSATLEIKKSITLDLNENTLSKSLASTSDTTPVIKALSGTVEIKNGEITYDIATYTGTTGTSYANVINVGMNMSNGIYSGGDCDLTLNGVDVSVTFPKGKSLSMIYVESGKLNVINSNLSATNVSGNTKDQYLIYTTAHASAKVNPYVSISGSTTLDTNSSAGIHAIWLQGSNDTLIISGNDVAISAVATWKPYSWSSTYSYAYAVNNQSGATCTIEGGKFLGKVWQTKGTIDVSGGYFGYAQGTLGQENKITLAEGYEYLENTDPATMDAYPYVVAAPAVAEVNGTGYATLAEAIDAANDGDTVTLLSNVTLTGTQEIAKNLTINGNNKTVTAPEGNAAGKVYYVFYVVDAGGSAISVTLKDMTLNTTGYQVAVMANGDYNSTVNVNNVDITTDGAAIYANGHMTVQATGCDIVRSGMYTTGKDNAYYSALNVGYGGTLEATDCDITVNGGNGAASFPSGGTFTLTNVNITVAQDDESGLAAGYALWSRNEDYTNYPDYCMDSVINVTSGTINGDLFLTDKYPAGDAKNLYAPKISATGGTFDHDPTAYVADGYEAVDNGNGTWTVSSIKVAQIGNVKYATLADAIAAVPTDGTVTTIVMLADYEAPMDHSDSSSGGYNVVNIAKDKNVILDLNGKTITGVIAYDAKNSAVITVSEYGTLTVRDTSAAQTGTITHVKYDDGVRVGNWAAQNWQTDILFNHGGTLTVESGTIANTANGNICYAIDTSNNYRHNDATLTITGGTITSQYCEAIRMRLDSPVYGENSGRNVINVSGGTISGRGGIWAQVSSGTAPKGSLTITGGTITGGDWGTLTYSAGSGVSIDDFPASITGGKITGTVSLPQENYISGGKFSLKPEAACIAEGYEAVANTDDDAASYPFVVTEAAPVDVYTAAAAAATGTLSLGGTGNTFRFTITKNGTKLNKTAEYSAEKDNWELVYDTDYIQLTADPTAASNGIGYKLKGIKAGTTTITFQNKADHSIYASVEVTINHKVTLTYNRTADATNPDRYLVEKGALTISKITFDGVAYAGEDLNSFLEDYALTVEGNATINGLDIIPSAAGDVYVTVTKKDDAAVTARAGKIAFVDGVARIGDNYYVTLNLALKAAQSGDTVTLIQDVTESVFFTGNTPRVDGFALTIDLNGHTFTAPADKDFALRVDYGIITIKDSVGTGGINYGKNYAIIISHLAGDYISKVIIESGTFTGKTSVVQVGYPAGSGANYKYYGGELEVLGGTFVTVADTNENYDANGNFRYTLNMLDMNPSAYAGGIYSPSSITVKGGTFNGFDPSNNLAEGANTNFVAEGYEAVKVNSDTWQVGEIKASAIAAQETVTENYDATYTANKKVVDENDVTLAQDTSITVNLKAENNEVSTGNVLNKQYDVSTIVAAIVEAEGAKASTLNVSITVVKDNPDVVVENNKKTVTYEVHPVATITNEDGDTLGTYTISNDQLAGGATFVIKLPVPAELQTSSGRVKVTHKLSDGSTVVYGSLAYDDEGFITIADVAEFSEFELEIAETVTASASYGFTLALKNKIEIPLYVYNLTDDAYNYFVEYSYTDADGLYVHNTVCLDNYSIGNGWYRFVVAEFSARQMSDEVYVRLYNNGTGENIYNGYYSIKQYCEYMIGGGTQTQSLIKLCKAALDYGKAAQLYFDYNLSSPIADSYYFLNSGVTIGSEHASSFSSYLFDFVGATVSLKSQVQVNFYFRGGYYGGYTFKVNGEQVQPLEQGGYYVVSVSGITAKDLGKPVTVTVTSYGEEETFSYSPLAYAYYIQQNSQNNELIDVCKAMYLYWSAANDYLN